MMIFIPLLFCSIGLIGLIWSFIIISRSIDSEDWIPTQCEILESTVKEDTGDLPRHRALIKYKYSVNGLSYEGDTVKIGPSSISELVAYKIWIRYLKGSIAEVYVDPKNPKRSVLIPGISPSIYGPIIIYILFFVFGTSGFLYELFK